VKVSHDSQFVEKTEGQRRLYLNPPEQVMVLCADEKSQIQVLDRTPPGRWLKRPLRNRDPRLQAQLQAQRTATQFAAMSTLNGTVIRMCDDRRHQEWLKLLRVIDQVTPSGKEIHLIADNYATHRTSQRPEVAGPAEPWAAADQPGSHR